ncbi:MAG TPA: STAS domain-containing protein [Amycolatopsis sp.]|nr:STAS domain-containing protein [Amycolatopsis sp.]
MNPDEAPGSVAGHGTRVPCRIVLETAADHIPVVAVAGEVDLMSEAALRTHLDAALGEKPEVLIVDLGEVSFFASCGLAALLRAQQQAAEQRTEIRVVADDRRVIRPLTVTGVDQLLKLYPSRAAATGDGPAGGEQG